MRLKMFLMRKLLQQNRAEQCKEQSPGREKSGNASCKDI